MPQKSINIAGWIILFLGLSIAFNNCSKPFEVSGQLVNNRPSPNSGIGNETFPGCIIPELNMSSKLTPTRSAFDSQKLIMAESDSADYVSIVSSECLNNAELKNRSNFTQRMNLQSGPERHAYWVKKINRASLPAVIESLENELEQDPCLIGLSPNREYKLNLVQADFDDTFLPQVNHLDSLNFFDSLTTFYDPTLGLQEELNSVRVRVAVIDTGAFYDHPDLADNIYRAPNGVGVDATTIESGNAIYDGTDVDEAVSHGTHVSGIIAARGANAIGLTGLAPQSVQILPINVFYKNDPADTEVVSDSATLIRGIQFAVSENADVINLSLGGGGDDPALFAALQAAVNAGIFISAAASNEGREISPDFRTYPAYYAKDIDGMVAVGSINSADKTRSSFSNYGVDYVEIAAPGSESEVGTQITGIASTFEPDNYARLFGTSQAAPMVSAAAALAEGLIRQNGGSITPAQMERLMLASAEKRSALNTEFRNGNVLNLQRLAAFVNANYSGTGNLAFQTICQQ